MTERSPNETLYSLDVYVSHVTHYGFETVSPTFLNDCCVGFRLWDYPLIYIQTTDGHSNLTPNQQEFDASLRSYSQTLTRSVSEPENLKHHRIKFNAGKSCVFRMSKTNLTKNLSTSPLYVFLFVLTLNDNDQVKPNLIGTVTIPMVDLDLPEVEGELPKRVLSGSFDLVNDHDFKIGLIDIDIRLRKLPQSRLSTFDSSIKSFYETADQKTSRESSTPALRTTFSLQRPMTAYDEPSQSGNRSSVSMSTNRPQSASATMTTTVPASLVMDKNVTWSRRKTIRSPLEGLGDLTDMVLEYKEHQKQTQNMKYMLENTVSQLTDHLNNITIALRHDPTPIPKPKKKKVVVKKKKKKTTTASGVQSRYMDIPSFSYTGFSLPTKSSKKTTSYTVTNSYQTRVSPKRKRSPSPKRRASPKTKYIQQKLPPPRYNESQYEYQDQAQDTTEFDNAVRAIVQPMPPDLKVVIKKKRDSVPDMQPQVLLSPAHVTIPEVVSIPQDLYHTRNNKNIRYMDNPNTPMPHQTIIQSQQAPVVQVETMIEQSDPLRTKNLLLEQQRKISSNHASPVSSPIASTPSSSLHVNNMITPSTPAIGVNQYQLNIDTPSSEKPIEDDDEESFPVHETNAPVITVTSASIQQEKEEEEFTESFEVDQSVEEPVKPLTQATPLDASTDDFSEEFEEYGGQLKEYNPEDDERI